MNINYRIIWNATIGKWVVASELAKGRKKTSRKALVGALAVALAASAPLGAAFAADTATTCTTSDGQSGVLDTNGICAVEPGAMQTFSGIGVLGATDGGSAPGANAVAVGPSSLASGVAAVAVGLSATASSGGDVAIGRSTNANGSGMGAVVVGSNASALGEGGVSVGTGAVVSANGATALGMLATASAVNSFALGSNTVADRANTVSVGSDVAGSAFTRQIVNVGAGTQANDAVNVSQLSPVVTALGGGATIDPNTGAVTGPTYTLANGGTQTTVAGALGALDSALTTTNGNVTNNTTAITDIRSQLNNGTVGLVQQASAGANLTVGANTDGTTVDFTGTSGTRTLTGVANGTINATSADAVNGSQLFGTANSVAGALGGGATVNPDGTISTPSYSVAGTTVHSVGDAITNIDGRVTQNSTNISDLTDQLNSGSVGLVQQASSGANLTVGANTNGGAVDFTGTSGARILTGVANGVNDSDAVTIAQLKATGLIDYTGKELGALVYDDLTLGTATLGGVGGTIIDNLKNGLIAAGSMQAVNGGQLFDLQQNFQGQFDSLNNQVGDLNNRVGTIEQGIADGSIGGGGGGTPGYGPGSGSGDNSLVVGDGANASGSNSSAIGNGAVASGNGSTATGAGAVASGSNSTAVGSNAQATGNNSTALGANSQAKADNSVALGEGSVADRANTVSVGSAGNERQITNVAAGTQRTDAANWGQVQDAVNGVQDWANQKFHQVDKRIDRMGAMSAAYGQMAFSANGLDTKNRMGVGIGAQNGQSALAVGYSRQIRPNMNLSFGGSASAGDVSVGAGLAVGW